jgi:serine/threonine-protein kinase
VYSLGCVLYECLAGRVPFSESGDAAVLWAHMSETPVPPSELRDDVTESIDAVISRAMAKDVDARFPGCRELVAALEPAAGAAVPIATRPIELPVAMPASAAPPAPPHRWCGPAVVAEPAGKIGVAAGVLSWWLGWPQPPRSHYERLTATRPTPLSPAAVGSPTRSRRWCRC